MENNLSTINMFVMITFGISIFLPSIFKNTKNDIVKTINSLFIITIYHIVFVWALFFAVYNGFKQEPETITSLIYYFVSVTCFYYIGWGDVGEARDKIIEIVKQKLSSENEDKK